MIEGICDIHSHILPGLDDGSQNEEETVQALQEAYRQGVRRIIMTPHYYPELYETDARVVWKLCQDTQKICKERNLDIQIMPGQECYYYSGLADKLDHGEVLTLAESRYVLVEFSPDCPFVQLKQGLSELQQRGYKPILAHFERYSCLEKEERLSEIRSRGILLQMNYDTLLYKKNRIWKTRWQKMAIAGIPDLFGSDCHGTHFRPLHIQEGVQWLRKHVDAELAEQMLIHNPKEILRKTRWE